MPHESTVNHESSRWDSKRSMADRKDQASGSNHPNSKGVSTATATNKSTSVATNTTAHSTPVDGNTPGTDVAKPFKVSGPPDQESNNSTNPSLTTATGVVDSDPKQQPSSPTLSSSNSSSSPPVVHEAQSTSSNSKHGHLEKSQSLLPHVCPEKPTEVTHHHDTDEEDSENSDETK